MAKKCGKCEKTVYHAEWVQGCGQYWHKSCWRCSVCEKSFAPQDSNAKQKDNALFCKKCYEEKFGAHTNVVASVVARVAPSVGSFVKDPKFPDKKFGAGSTAPAISSVESESSSMNDPRFKYLEAPTGDSCKVDRRVEFGYGCDECMKTIDCDKPRWHCVDCTTDYCSGCHGKKIFATAQQHSYTHRLIELKHCNSSFLVPMEDFFFFVPESFCCECRDGNFSCHYTVGDFHHGKYKCTVCNDVALCYECLKKTKLLKCPQHDSKHQMIFTLYPYVNRLQYLSRIPWNN